MQQNPLKINSHHIQRPQIISQVNFQETYNKQRIYLKNSKIIQKPSITPLKNYPEETQQEIFTGNTHILQTQILPPNQCQNAQLQQRMYQGECHFIQSPLVITQQPYINTTVQYSETEELESIIGYTFTDKSHLLRALTSRSFDQKSNYEIYEFFGDSILGLIATEFVVYNFPSLKESELANLQQHLVQNSTLSQFSRWMNLKRFIRHANINELGEASKVWADIFEALVAAIYLDGGYNASKNFVLRFFSMYLDALDENKLKEIFQ